MEIVVSILPDYKGRKNEFENISDVAPFFIRIEFLCAQRVLYF